MDKSIRKHRTQLRKKIDKLKSSNPKEYWKIINSGRKTGVPEIPTNILFDHFKGINSDSQYDQNEADLVDAQEFQVLNEQINGPITEEEIFKAIKRLKNDKASGDDQIINEYLKSSFPIMSEVYVRLFNVIFENGLVPEQWLLGNMIPIYKNKGDKMDPANFRPITIISCFGKLFTSILNDRLNDYSEQFNIICENQGGFRQNYSTADNMFVLHSLIHLMKSKRKRLFCMFVDFEKAFDKVWREGLWNKLLLSNINGKMYHIIVNLYNGIKSRICYNGNTTDYFNCNVGVRQGESLSPFLFSLFLNDLEEYLINNNVHGLESISDEIEKDIGVFLKLLILLYADDTVLFAESHEDLQIQIDKFHQYCIGGNFL